MDVERLRLEREENRRQRRERIRKILDDDTTGSSRCRDETKTSTTLSTSTARSRRACEDHTATHSASSERMRHTNNRRDEQLDGSSPRPTRASRLRDNAISSNTSTRHLTSTADDGTTRSVTRRRRDEDSTTTAEKSQFRSDRTTRTRHTATDRSSLQTEKATRSFNQESSPETGNMLDSARLRREARRRRNKEHSDNQSVGVSGKRQEPAKSNKHGDSTKDSIDLEQSDKSAASEGKGQKNVTRDHEMNSVGSESVRQDFLLEDNESSATKCAQLEDSDQISAAEKRGRRRRNQEFDESDVASLKVQEQSENKFKEEESVEVVGQPKELESLLVNEVESEDHSNKASECNGNLEENGSVLSNDHVDGTALSKTSQVYGIRDRKMEVSDDSAIGIVESKAIRNYDLHSSEKVAPLDDGSEESVQDIALQSASEIQVKKTVCEDISVVDDDVDGVIGVTEINDTATASEVETIETSLIASGNTKGNDLKQEMSQEVEIDNSDESLHHNKVVDENSAGVSIVVNAETAKVVMSTSGNVCETNDSDSKDHDDVNKNENKAGVFNHEANVREEKSKLNEDEERFCEEVATTDTVEMKDCIDGQMPRPDNESTKTDKWLENTSDNQRRNVRDSKEVVGDESWKKNVRKTRGAFDINRTAELTALGKVGKIRNKMKNCEARDVESAEQWKKQIKTGRKHKSFDEETEKELRELSRKRDLRNIVQSCEEKDKESAKAWKRVVKKDSRKHKSLDEETENELKEISKSSLLRDRIKECEEKDIESASAWTKKVKKGARKHKSLDEETENELKEVSKASLLRDRIKECEEKDRESASAWTKEVKKCSKPLDPDNETQISEELKEISESSRLKDIISSCAERDEKRNESWKTAKERGKSLDEESELVELSGLSDVKNKIIQECEERDRQSAHAAIKKVTSDSKKKVNTTDEELKEQEKCLDVKANIHTTAENEQVETSSKNLIKGEESTKIDLTYEEKEDATEKTSSTQDYGYKRTYQHVKDSGDKVETVWVEDSASQSKKDTIATNNAETNYDCEKSRKEDSSKARISNKNDGKLKNEITPPTKRDSGRISLDKRAHSKTTSPTKSLKDGTASITDDKNEANGGSGGRVSPVKNKTRIRSDIGRVSPTKGLSGRISSEKHESSSGKGQLSHTKEKTAKSKLDNIRANLMEGGKSKPKNKRESLNNVKKAGNIKDKIAACKERDKAAPRTITFSAPSKPKVRDEPKYATGKEADAFEESGSNAPVNSINDQYMPAEEEAISVDIKGALSFWNDPSNEEAQKDSESPSKDAERPPPVFLSNVRQGWKKRNWKLNVSEFIKELLSSNCQQRKLEEIKDVKSDTKKYLTGGMQALDKVATDAHDDVDDLRTGQVSTDVEFKNRKNARIDDKKKSDGKPSSELSFDDVVNPENIKQLGGFSKFRRQVRPANRRAAKSNPIKKLQQRDDVITGTENFHDVEEESEEEELKPTAIGRLGRAIEPGDKQSKHINNYADDTLAGLAATEDASKITLKKTSKSKTGVSKEKSEYDGTAPVMLLQIKGHRNMQTRLVEPSVSSLNSADSFVLVTPKSIHVWNGKDSNVMKKSKASEISNRILQYKLLNCNATVVTTIKDGSVNIDTGLTRSFWNTLGGRKTVKGSKEIPKDNEYEKAVVACNVVYAVDTTTEPATLKKISEHSGRTPKIAMLDSNQAFVFDFGTEVYAWLGRTCEKTSRSQAVELALDIYKSPFEVQNSLNPITPNMVKDDNKPRYLKRPSWALFGRMTERAETILFEQKFHDWPDVVMKVKLDKEKDLLNTNLSKGYAKRMAQIEQSEYEAVELVPCDGHQMAEEPPPVSLILDGVNVGRGRGSYDELERRGVKVTTNSVTVYHSSEKESRQLEEREWGHFYSSESYVIRWSFSVKASGIRSLKGGQSKRDTKGRDQIAYFFWHGRDCSTSGKGTSALTTVELDSDKSPQIMVDEGHESACFLNMFDGQMIVHHGKCDEAKTFGNDNVFMYCVHNEDEREICLSQVEARSSNLRSRSSFVIVVVDKTIGVCIWHGAKSTEQKKGGALRGAKRLVTWYSELFL